MKRAQSCKQAGVNVCPAARGSVVGARPLVPQGLSDENVRGVIDLLELARGGHADDELGAADRKLFGNQDSERGADSIADDPERCVADLRDPHVGVVTSPASVALAGATGLEVPDDVAVGVQDADGGYGEVEESPLPARFTEQILGPEHARAGVVLGRQRCGHGISVDRCRAGVAATANKLIVARAGSYDQA